MAKLTKKVVDALPALPGGDYFAWDDTMPCFGVRVMPSGAKTFQAQYKIGARTRRMSLGRYGTLTVEQGRDLARQVLAKVASGADPAEDRAEKRRGLSVAELGQRYMEEHALPHKKPLSCQMDRRLLDQVIVPALGTRPANTLSRRDVARLMHD